MIPTPNESIHHNDVIIQNTSYLPLARTVICWLIIHEYPKLHNIISNKWLSKYPNITWNCIPSRKKMSMHILCQKKILLYELEEISKPISHLDMLFLQPRCYLLYPLEKFTIFEPLNCKNRELNTKEGKEILLVWIVMNLENDRWKICMQISEENHLSF